MDLGTQLGAKLGGKIEPRQAKTGQDRTGQDKTRQDKDRTRQDFGRQRDAGYVLGGGVYPAIRRRPAVGNTSTPLKFQHSGAFEAFRGRRRPGVSGY